MAKSPNERSLVRRAWGSWQQVDAARGLIQFVLSLGWVGVAVLTFGGAVLSIALSAVLVALGWIADWSVYVVAAVAISVATIPNYLMWRHRRTNVSPAVSPSERLILVSPLDGARVTCPFEVRGYANAMEGNIIAETKNENGDWYVITHTMARLGPDGHLYLFSTHIDLSPGKHLLRVCAEPFMADERYYGDCAEIEITVEE